MLISDVIVLNNESEPDVGFGCEITKFLPLRKNLINFDIDFSAVSKLAAKKAAS